MKKDKIIKFLKERWQHILLWVAGVLLVLIILIGKCCNLPPTLQAYSEEIYNIDGLSYPIFTYDSFLLRSDIISENYTSFPITNEIFDTLDTTTSNRLSSDIGEFRFNIPTPQQYRISMLDGPPITEIVLFSSYMYIPNNILDYYTVPDRLMIGPTSSPTGNFTCTINLSYKLHTTSGIEIEDSTISYNLNSLFADGFDVFNGLDLTGLVFEDGCFITDYYLSILFPESISIYYFEISRLGVIELPITPLYPSLSGTSEVCPEVPTSVDVGSFLASSIGAFMDFELFPGFSISGLLATILAVGLFILFLKVFAGG